MNDLNTLFHREEVVARWRAERENASARLEIAEIKRRMSFLLSQHEPVHGLNIDREVLRKLFLFVETGRPISPISVEKGINDER